MNTHLSFPALEMLSNPIDGIVAVGSGGSYALSAAGNTRETHKIKCAGYWCRNLSTPLPTICIYTNKNFTIEEL